LNPSILKAAPKGAEQPVVEERPITKNTNPPVKKVNIQIKAEETKPKKEDIVTSDNATTKGQPILKTSSLSSKPEQGKVKDALVKFNSSPSEKTGETVPPVPKAKPKPPVIKPTPANFAVVKLAPSTAKPVTLSNRIEEINKN